MRILPLLAFITWAQLVPAQVSRFYQSFEAGDVEYGYAIGVLPNRDLILSGPLGWGPNGADAYLMRLDQAGNVLWNFAYGEVNADQGADVAVLPDGFLQVGTHSAVSNGNGEGLIVRTDVNGQVVWARALSGPLDESLYSCAVLPSGDFVVSGQTNSFGAGNVDAWLARISASGNLMWTRTFGGTGIEAGFGVEVTLEGDILMSGYTNSFGPGGYNGFLAKFDTLGNFKWGNAYGGTGGDLSYRALVSRQGGYLLTGYSTTLGVGGQDGFAIRTDTAGNILWANAYGSPAMDRIFHATDAPTSGFYLTGETTTNTFGAGDHMILRVDLNGNLVWAYHYGTPVDETGYGTSVLTPDGGLALACWDDNAEDAVVLKIDSLGDLGCARGPISPTVTPLAIAPVRGGAVGTGGTIFPLNIVAEPFSFSSNVYCSVVLGSGRLMGAAESFGNHLRWQGEFPLGAQLQKSVDGHYFFEIAAAREVIDDGNGWTDITTDPVAWYRLGWTSPQGTFQYSNIVEVNRLGQAMNFSPVYIGGGRWDCGLSHAVTVWDQWGRRIMEKAPSERYLSVEPLSSGIYWVTGTFNEQTWVAKIIKQ